jgi:hypothetical protein
MHHGTQRRHDIRLHHGIRRDSRIDRQRRRRAGHENKSTDLLDISTSVGTKFWSFEPGIGPLSAFAGEASATAAKIRPIAMTEFAANMLKIKMFAMSAQ